MSASHDPEIGAPRETPEHIRVPIGLERSLGAAAMGLICLISFSNVLVRYATDFSFAFTEEFSVFLLVFMTFVGVSLAFATDENIRIVFFRDRFGPRGRLLCDVVAALASFLMFSLVLWYGGLLTWDEYRFEETSPGLGYPNWLYTIWLPLLAAAILLRILGRFIGRLRQGEGGA
ncbi:MAG: TRAP transporter small permease [Tistlia sp.]|uniref:TRAP transporter small permease n=1 Tax=Tistlia sp. TaxID=3057121 RepID=UPI0034A1B9E1